MFAFVVLRGERPTGDVSALVQELRNWVGEQVGAIAKPDEIRFADNLPKTRSGKIMRRLLRSVARGEEISQDVSTLENPAILDQLRGTDGVDWKAVASTGLTVAAGGCCFGWGSEASTGGSAAAPGAAAKMLLRSKAAHASAAASAAEPAAEKKVGAKTCRHQEIGACEGDPLARNRERRNLQASRNREGQQQIAGWRAAVLAKAPVEDEPSRDEPAAAKAAAGKRLCKSA